MSTPPEPGQPPRRRAIEPTHVQRRRRTEALAQLLREVREEQYGADRDGDYEMVAVPAVPARAAPPAAEGETAEEETAELPPLPGGEDYTRDDARDAPATGGSSRPAAVAPGPAGAAPAGSAPPSARSASDAARGTVRDPVDMSGNEGGAPWGHRPGPGGRPEPGRQATPGGRPEPGRQAPPGGRPGPEPRPEPGRQPAPGRRPGPGRRSVPGWRQPAPGREHRPRRGHADHARAVDGAGRRRAAVALGVTAAALAGFALALLLPRDQEAPARAGAPRTTPSAPAAAPAPPGGADPDGAGTLREGDSGPDVVALQRRLLRVPDVYTGGSADGSYDATLTAAVARFQLWYGIRGDETGVYGDDTRAALESRTAPAP